MTMHLLVATDGTDMALGALRQARALSQKRAATVQVLAVLPTAPPPPPRIDGSPADPAQSTDSAVTALRALVEHQLAGLGASTESWPVAVEIGPPAETIARTAAEVNADLILIGGPGPGADAVLGAETTLEVVHRGRIPVIAVASRVTDLPRRVLVGVDLHAPELSATTAILLEISDPRAIHLAHVAWEVGPSGPGDTDQWQRRFVARLAAQLEQLAGKVRLSTRAHVDVHVPIGDWDLGLLGLGRRLGVDLIATGSHAYGELGRAFTRSVSTAVLHGATCSVLIVPTLQAHASPPRASSPTGTVRRYTSPTRGTRAGNTPSPRNPPRSS